MKSYYSLFVLNLFVFIYQLSFQFQQTTGQLKESKYRSLFDDDPDYEELTKPVNDRNEQWIKLKDLKVIN